MKTSSLGDIIHAFHVPVYLKTKFPHATVDWVVEGPFAELVEAHPHIDAVVRIDTRQWRKGSGLAGLWKSISALRKQTYDVVFDLQSNFKSGVFTGLARAKQKVGFSSKHVSEWPNLLFTKYRYDAEAGCNVREESLSLVQQHFADTQTFAGDDVKLALSNEEKHHLQRLLADCRLGHKRKIMVCPGSAWPNKQISPEALLTFLKLIRQNNPCFFFLVWGNTQEKAVVETIRREFPENTRVLDKLRLPVLQNLMDAMDLVIAMDSLPLHLAGTTSTATFSVFGASSASKYKPYGSQHKSYQGTCPYGRTFERRCPILRTCPTGACIRSLTGEQLFEAFQCGSERRS